MMNRNIRRMFFSPFLFVTLFVLFISVCAIFLLIANLLIANEKDTKFNTKDDKVKRTFHSDDDVTETESFTNNLPSKKDLHTVSNTSFAIFVMFGFLCLVIALSVIFYQIYMWLLNRIRPVRYQPLVNLDADADTVRIPLNYNSSEDVRES